MANPRNLHDTDDVEPALVDVSNTDLIDSEWELTWFMDRSRP